MSSRIRKHTAIHEAGHFAAYAHLTPECLSTMAIREDSRGGYVKYWPEMTNEVVQAAAKPAGVVWEILAKTPLSTGNEGYGTPNIDSLNENEKSFRGDRENWLFSYRGGTDDEWLELALIPSEADYLAAEPIVKLLGRFFHGDLGRLEIAVAYSCFTYRQYSSFRFAVERKVQEGQRYFRTSSMRRFANEHFDAGLID